MDGAGWALGPAPRGASEASSQTSCGRRGGDGDGDEDEDGHHRGATHCADSSAGLVAGGPTAVCERVTFPRPSPAGETAVQGTARRKWKIVVSHKQLVDASYPLTGVLRSSGGLSGCAALPMGRISPVCCLCK